MKKKWFFIIGGVIVLAVFVFLALKSSNVKKTAVTVEMAGKGEITSIVTATGKVKAQADVQISADVMGRIEKLPVKEGDTVKTGQLTGADRFPFAPDGRGPGPRLSSFGQIGS